MAENGRIYINTNMLALIIFVIAICYTAVNYWLVYISVESFEGFVVSGHPIFYMVPFAFSSYLCFAIVLISGICYLSSSARKIVVFPANIAYNAVKKRELIIQKEDFDLVLVSAAQIGVIVAGLTILIGMTWAYVEWGYFWQWEPRETATLIMWLAYAGLLIFREMLDEKNPERKATVTAIFGLAASPSVPLTYFVQGALHVGGGSVIGGGLSPGAGPVLMMNFVLVGSLTVVLIYLTFRTNKIDLKLKEIRSAKMAE